MALDAFVVPWSGVAYRHLPAGALYDVLDFRYAGRSADNRWNRQGEPTLYVAGDVGVVIAEFGRHFEVNRAPALAGGTVTRTVYRLDFRLDHVLDLRDAQVAQALSLRDAPFCFADIDIARATAQFVRHTTTAQAVFVPSVAMLDKLDRWAMALFLEKLPADPARFITSVRVEGPLRWK